VNRAIFLLLFVSLEIGSDPLLEDSFRKLQARTKKVELENGLRLILVQRTESPTLAIYSKFLVGAVDESDQISGTAHLLEHMLFKGTPNVGTLNWERESRAQTQIEIWGNRLDRLKLEKRIREEKGETLPPEFEQEIQKWEKRLQEMIRYQDQFLLKNEDSFIYEQNGQTGFNAYTSQDVTNYQIQLPANRLEIWAKMESDRLKNPILREFYTERDVVIEERRMRTENSGPALLWERFLATAFESHPYGRPIIGYPSVIPFLDLRETAEFFRRYYHAGNLVIAIVGDQDFEKTEGIVRKYFSDLPGGTKSPLSRLSEIQTRGRKQVEVLYPSGELLLLGWRKPTFPHKDNSVFEILESVLAEGRSSRLYKRLVLESKLASSVQAYNGNPGERYTNLFTISVQPREGSNPEEIERIIWEEFGKIEKQGISDKEIKKIQNNAIAEFFSYMDKNSSLADTLSYYELLAGDWKSFFQMYENMNQITSEDIQRVVQKYLQKDLVTVGILRDSRKNFSREEKK